MKNIKMPGQRDIKTLSKKDINRNIGDIVFYVFLFLIPIFFLPITINPVFFSKQILVGTVLLGLFVYVLVKFLTAGKITLPSRYLSLGLLALFLSVLISAIFSKARFVSLLGSSPDSLFWVGAYILTFLLAIVTLTNRGAILKAFFAYVAGIAVMATFALIQFSGITILPFDFAKDINFNPVGSVFSLGIVAAVGLVALLAYLMNSKSEKVGVRVLLWAVVGILIVLTAQINFWAIWVSLILAFVVIALTQSHKVAWVEKGAVPRLPLFPLFVIMGAIFALFVFQITPTFISVPVEISPTFNTTVDITKSSLEGTKIIYGTGPGTFPYNYLAHRPVEINQTNFWGVQFNQGYSAFLTYTSTWGILGITALLFVMALFVWKLYRGYVASLKRKSPDPAMESVVLAMLASVIFLSLIILIYQGNPVTHLLLFAAAGIGFSALSKMGITQKLHLDLMRSSRVMFISSITTIALVGVAAGIFYFVGLNYLANVYAEQGIRNLNEEQGIDKALEKLNTAVNIDANDDFILRMASQVLVIKLNDVLGDEELAQKEASDKAGVALQSAINLAEKAIRANSLNGQNWIQLARVYEAIIGFTEGAEDKALDAYKMAIELDPLNPSIPLSQARVQLVATDVLRERLNSLTQTDGDVAKEKELIDMRESRLDAAIELAESAINLKNNYSEARLVLASAYGRLGDQEEAIGQVQEAIRVSPRDPNLFFQLGLYQRESNSFDDASASFEKAIVLSNDKFANARFYLGLSQDALGNRQKAIEQFEIVLKDNPDNELLQKIMDNLQNGRSPLEGLTTPEAETPVIEAEEVEDLLVQ